MSPRDPSGELRPVLALARMDCAATLSSQVDGVVERAARQPGRAVDPAWWAAALHRPAREFDDGWARRCGPALRRAGSARTLRRTGSGVTDITHAGSRSAAPILAAAAAATLPAPRRSAGPARPGSAGPLLPGTLLPGSVLPGSVLSGTLLSGSVLSGIAGAWRLLPGAGPGLLLVLSGLALLAGAAVAARVRTVRVARARETAARVRTAVLAAAERELIRRTLDAERTAGVGAPVVTGARSAPRRAGAGRAA